GLSAFFLGGQDVSVDFLQRFVDARQMAIQIERELGPAEMLDVVRVDLLTEVADGGADARMRQGSMDTTPCAVAVLGCGTRSASTPCRFVLQSQQHQGSWAWNGVSHFT